MSSTREHRYAVEVAWTGNRGIGTSGYRSYERDHELRGEGKPPILASSDAAFRGNGARWNPEELLVASLSQCHALWYLHLCSTNDVVVQSYVDRAEGTMAESPDGSGYFTAVALRPAIALVSDDRIERARELHHDAHRACFIANSVNFPVTVEPTFGG